MNLCLPTETKLLETRWGTCCGCKRFSAGPQKLFVFTQGHDIQSCVELCKLDHNQIKLQIGNKLFFNANNVILPDYLSKRIFSKQESYFSLQVRTLLLFWDTIADSWDSLAFLCYDIHCQVFLLDFSPQLIAWDCFATALRNLHWETF